MKFSIIPDDGTIVIDGVSASTLDDRVSSMTGDDIHAIQYSDDKSIGHIEFNRDMYDTTPRKNEMIYELDTEKFITLHSTLLEEGAMKETEE